MVNPNVSDKFFEAVEDYNRTITDPKKKHLSVITDDERRGIFFNCLRRAFGWLISSAVYRRTISLNVYEMDCQFNWDGQLKKVTIKKYIPESLGGWEEEQQRINTMQQIKQLCNQLTTIHPTKVLNEMALIVNSIK